jgi:PAS domain S-box-containing protein
MAWENLSTNLQHIILISGSLGAIVTIWLIVKKGWRKLISGVNKIAWLFTEQHDHEVIKQSLDEIALQLTNNGGTSLKDALDRIENKQDLMTARMRAHLNTNSKAIFETDSAGHVIYVNRAYEKLTGHSGADVGDMGWVNIIEQGDRSRVVDLWFHAVKGRRNFDECLTIKNPNGAKSKAHAMAYVIRDTEGKMLGHIGEIALIEQT